MKNIYVWASIVFAIVLIITAIGAKGVKDTQTTTEFGYLKIELQQIYKEVVAAEDQAREESEARCPTNGADPNTKVEDTEKCVEQKTELSAQYRKQVLEKYGISKEEWSEIGHIAFKENWPLD